MFQHGTRTAFALCLFMGGKPAVADMPAITALVGADVIAADNAPGLFGDK